MAQRVVTILTSDISGEEIPAGEGETVYFALDGTSYEIDLTAKEADELRDSLKNYIALGRRTSPSRRVASSPRSGSGRTPEELAHVRAWAKENGHEVSERGRIKKEILDAFDAAN
ncbi:histone-like nucleoid-structuring protein Lsr2 [Aeromicrobium duanguangcaii]|uniref:histone-like nucleoid-structuring protein Lsr2 n=1 Tax=Aeromicrobium duanguangcaii TaxID=2968086 RepID=UPI0020170D70|nr:Lsr2 family protein [Aeromicrobium duanguangcaii]MCL3838750.1 Lsr2 family protein [Aeromicrobium duanguangcaii]